MIKVNLFHEDSTFNAVAEFPEAPQIGDKVQILNFLRPKTPERDGVLLYFNNKKQDTKLTVKERTWTNGTDGVFLIVELEAKIPLKYKAQ